MESAQQTPVSAGTPYNTGEILSNTIISCEAADKLPQVSVAVHVRMMVNWLGQESLMIESETMTVILPAQLSETITESSEAAGTPAAHCSIMVSGT